MDYEKELAETVAALPQEPPEGFELFCKSKLNGNVLVYKAVTDSGKKKILGHCTACGEKSYFEYKKIKAECWRAGYSEEIGFVDPFDKDIKKSHSTCCCPICGAGLTAMHTSKINETYEICETRIHSLQNVRGHLAFLSWDVKKLVNKEGKIFFKAFPEYGVLSLNKKTIRLVGKIRSYSQYCGYFYTYKKTWTSSAKFYDEVGICSRESIMPFDDTVKKTDAEKSAFDEYLNSKEKWISPAAYLKIWEKYPNVENLIRQHQNKIVEGVISRARTYYGSNGFKISNIKSIVNWKETKPHLMLGVNKNELSFIQNFTLDELQFYKHLKKLGVHPNEEMIKKASRIGLSGLMSLLEHEIYGERLHPVSLINYLEKQRVLDCNRNRERLLTPEYLNDYWDCLFNVYGTIPNELMFPRDLAKKHNQILKLVKEKTDPVIDSKIRKFAKDLMALSYENQDLKMMIRPIMSQEELIKEGKILSHCVARYAKSYSERKTSIFCIRNTAEPEMPFYTLEYRDGFVNQNRGHGNCERTKEVQHFEQIWLEKIKNIRRNKDGTYGNNAPNGNSADAAS